MENSRNFKICNADDSAIDYMPWMLEKLEYVIKDLLSVQTVDEYIQSARFEAIKIYSFCIGETVIYEDDEIYKFIIDNGIDGFEYVKYALGITSIEGKIARLYNQQTEDNENILKIKSLITLENNRTELYDYLRVIHCTNEWTDSIIDDADEVSIGNKPWEWFYNKHKDDDVNRYLYEVIPIPDSLKR